MMRFLSLLCIGLVGWTFGQEWPGPKPDGTTLLPNGWSLRPHGRQIPLRADLPIRMAWHPNGRWLAIQHAGFREHEVVLFDVVAEKILATFDVGKTWSGLTFSPDGTRLFVSGGVEDRIHALSVDGKSGALSKLAEFPVGTDGVLDLPAGLCLDIDGKVFVPLQRSHRIERRTQGGVLDLTIPLPKGSFPFECVVHDGKLYVSLWGAASVGIFDAKSGESVAMVPSGEHPSEMVVDAILGRLFVSNGNENTVTVIGLASNRREESIGSALFPESPPGSTPNALALSHNGGILLVANADNNNCAVIDVSERGRSRSLGFIPLGAYPTSVRLSKDGKVVVTNGKGSGGSRRNPGGPDPVTKEPRNLAEYTGSMFVGSLSVFQFPSPARLQELSKIAYRCSPLSAAAGVRGVAQRPKDSPIPARVGDPSPIRHCVYIIKENRTYDQVLGDDPRGNGDASLCLFPEEVTPNHHALAREFVLMDNFYVEAEVSADGHEWTMGAYATDFVERTWPIGYGGKDSALQEGGGRRSLGYPAEGNFTIAFPKSRYLWDRAKEAGISFRSYGEFVRNGATESDPGTATYPTLEGHFDPYYRSYDLAYPDVKRAARFLKELAQFEEKGEYPRLVVLRLPNDHTSGTRPKLPTPRAHVADNDLALGMVIAGLSRSRFWSTMSVFVVEDDAQNGPDHVDAHRSIGFLAGPYVKRGAVVSTMYSTCSMLRTMELILGLPPMSQFDAGARPLFDCFVGKPDLRPYEVSPARWDLNETNKETAYGATRSLEMNLASEDAADDIELNEIIWRSIRGADAVMPVPRRAAFVRVVDE